MTDETQTMKVEWEEVAPGLWIITATNGRREYFIFRTQDHIAVEESRRRARAAKLRKEIEARTRATRAAAEAGVRDA